MDLAEEGERVGIDGNKKSQRGGEGSHGGVGEQGSRWPVAKRRLLLHHGGVEPWLPPWPDEDDSCPLAQPKPQDGVLQEEMEAKAQASAGVLHCPGLWSAG